SSLKNAGGQLSRVFQRGKARRNMIGALSWHQRPRTAAVKEPGKNEWRARTARISTYCYSLHWRRSDTEKCGINVEFRSSLRLRASLREFCAVAKTRTCWTMPP
ncbi:MAG: hypothetical protein ABI624_24570, partial [Casimicrobiaceae bacterium]